MGCALCCGWDERYKLPLPKGLPAGQRWKCSHCPEQGSTWSRGWLKRIRPAGVPLPVYRLKVVHTQHNLGNNPRGRTLAPVHRTSLSGNRKRQLNVRSSENVLMWKRTQSRDYSGNCDIDLNSLNCWSMPSHCTLDNFPTKHMNMFVCRRDESMIVSIYTNVKKKKKKYVVIFFLLLVDSFTSPPSKKNIYVYVLHNMNEGYLHCGILHWELLRQKTVSFSKVDSFWVLVCSQHCVFSASIWLCKYEDIKVSCK